MTNDIVVQDQSLFFEVDKFEHAQRVCKALSSSNMIPEPFQGNIPNTLIALNYAHRMGIDPFMLMQRMYIIHGKPAIETQLQIALFNKSGRFSTLKYKISGSGDTQQCIAYATDLHTNEEIEGPPVSIAMAKAEGWYSKKGSKWQTLPELMLRYRAAAFFIRLYAPESTMGLYTADELRDGGDVIDVTPIADPQAEIDANANQDVIDIKPEPAPGDEPKPETPAPAPDGSQHEPVDGPDF